MQQNVRNESHFVRITNFIENQKEREIKGKKDSIEKLVSHVHPILIINLLLEFFCSFCIKYNTTYNIAHLWLPHTELQKHLQISFRIQEVHDNTKLRNAKGGL